MAPGLTPERLDAMTCLAGVPGRSIAQCIADAQYALRVQAINEYNEQLDRLRRAPTPTFEEALLAAGIRPEPPTLQTKLKALTPGNKHAARAIIDHVLAAAKVIGAERAAVDAALAVLVG